MKQQIKASLLFPGVLMTWGVNETLHVIRTPRSNDIVFIFDRFYL